MSTFRFESPWAGLVGAVMILALAWLLYRLRARRASLVYSGITPFSRIKPGLSVRLRNLPMALRVVGLALLVVAFARPQTGHHEEEVLTEGIGIVLTIDNSRSMLAEDFRPKNRLGVAKDVVAQFVAGRRHDLIGLVVFAGNAYTRCPLTLDYDVLQGLLEGVEIAPSDDVGTAIGMGLATAVSRLRDTRARSRVIVLLTDGRNNRGQIDPVTGAGLAQALGIKVYTIGVGTEGPAPYPVDDPIAGRRYVYYRADIDEETLQEIARATGGQYFRATDSRSLEAIFERIDEMERTEIRVRGYTRHTERFAYFLYPGALLLALEFVVAGTVLRRIP